MVKQTLRPLNHTQFEEPFRSARRAVMSCTRTGAYSSPRYSFSFRKNFPYPASPSRGRIFMVSRQNSDANSRGSTSCSFGSVNPCRKISKALNSGVQFVQAVDRPSNRSRLSSKPGRSQYIFSRLRQRISITPEDFGVWLPR